MDKKRHPILTDLVIYPWKKIRWKLETSEFDLKTVYLKQWKQQYVEKQVATFEDYMNFSYICLKLIFKKLSSSRGKTLYENQFIKYVQEVRDFFLTLNATFLCI